MKHHRPLHIGALVTVGMLTVAAGAAVSITTSGTLAKPAARVSTVLAAIWHSMRVGAAHLTTAQLTEAAALAWLLFVLSLVLLARSRPKEPRTKAKVRETASVSSISEGVRVPEPLATAAVPHAPVAPVPARSVPVSREPSVHEAAGKAQRGHAMDSAAGVSTVPSAAMEPRVEDETLPKGVPKGMAWDTGGHTHDLTQGHTLALTGVTRTCDRLVPFGFFVVAEDAGATGGGGTASQCAVNTIAEQMASALAGTLALGSAQRAALLKMAVLHAGIDLAQQRIHTASDLDAAVTAAWVVEGVAHVATIGVCRAYRFRRYDGLVRLTPGEAGMPQPTRDRPLNEEARLTHGARDPVYSGHEGSRPPCDVDTCEVQLDPDDHLLLTSPRVWQALPQPHVEAILRAAPDSRAAARLLAYEAGSRAEGQDFGIIVVRRNEGWTPSFGIATRVGLL